MLKLECKIFLLKLKDFNGQNGGIDAELIKDLYAMTIVIADCIDQNPMAKTEPSRNGTATTEIEPRGSKLKCDVCNVRAFIWNAGTIFSYLLLCTLISTGVHQRHKKRFCHSSVEMHDDQKQCNAIAYVFQWRLRSTSKNQLEFYSNCHRDRQWAPAIRLRSSAACRYHWKFSQLGCNGYCGRQCKRIICR